MCGHAISYVAHLMIFEGCLDSNPKCCRSKRARNQLSTILACKLSYVSPLPWDERYRIPKNDTTQSSFLLTQFKVHKLCNLNSGSVSPQSCDDIDWELLWLSQNCGPNPNLSYHNPIIPLMLTLFYMYLSSISPLPPDDRLGIAIRNAAVVLTYMLNFAHNPSPPPL